MRAATSTLVVLMTIAGNGQKANPTQSARLSGMPHRQPSFFAIGLPSSTMLGVATQVLRKSIPRETSSSKKHQGVAAAAKLDEFLHYCLP